MNLRKEFKPKKNFKLIRIGQDNDEEYLLGVKNLLKSENLISFRILDDS